ncbi:undecaprenyldiphospho-muramoylpentapeptide beta-N-acetylglucosaminyltransferase [candidate division GN15 bacterium]|uniref:UDP-N-acetylglucosamine--N-acetylmuramyl-(pentapeptide) pyrophosphoryl-undecaprenol N-acetylglucosamine transferase n=1 Tax=candidate division GN15 bacterium TaxID=2072418 RepID=A0A855X3I5_9BACT|nr:MAG: undecaprenyldiphospho-muramoylpentapeptide beta-N-acetylglucosaminyltransferase [candidate division GN15 bacterium]
MSTSFEKTVRIVFAGGGTGGHLYPAIAIADRLTEMLGERTKAEIRFVGTKRGLEYRIKDSLKYPLHLINVRGIARRLSWQNLLVPFNVIGSLWKAKALLRQFSPHLVVGTGGYVSWPVLRAASGRGIPTAIQEQNSFPGITTRQLAPRVNRVYLGFAGAQEYFKTSGRVLVTGNPVRPNIAGGNRQEALSQFKLDPNKKTILVLGGSQGARAINQAVLHGLRHGLLPEGCQLLWQTGKRDYTEVTAQAGDKASGHSLFPYENRMELVYAAADLAIARAGAITLAELEACAVPSVLVPYPYAAGDHQRRNAEETVRQGFASVIDESDASIPEILKLAAGELLSGRAEQRRQTILAATKGKKPAVDVIAGDLIELMNAA